MANDKISGSPAAMRNVSRPMSIIHSHESKIGPITRTLSARLTVLIVDNSSTEAERIIHELEQTGYTVDAQRVDTVEALAAAVAKEPWDIIIASHESPA